MGKVFLDGYRRWLWDNGQEHSAAVLKHWLDTDYLDPSGNVHFLVHAIEGQVWKRPFGLYKKGEKFNIKRSDNTHLELDGWAFDARNTSLLAGLDVSLGDVAMQEVHYQIYSPWLIDDFGKEEYLYSGWSANQALDEVQDGCHDLFFTFHRLDGSSWKSPPSARICIK